MYLLSKAPFRTDGLGIPTTTIGRILLSFCLLSGSAWACGQSEKGKAERIPLWDGYEVSQGPTPQWGKGAESGCTSAIYNRSGQVVFRTTGYSAFYENTLKGFDFDGDGKPEVIFVTDTGGGNECCSAYQVVSLSPKPHLVLEIPYTGQAEFKRVGKDRVQLWMWEGGFTDYVAHAIRAFAYRVFEPHVGKLVDVTDSRCSEIMGDPDGSFASAKQRLTPETLRKLERDDDPIKFQEAMRKAKGPTEIMAIDKADQGPRKASQAEIGDLFEVALQHVYCHQYDVAEAYLNHWPKKTRYEMKTRFAASLP